MSFKDWCPKCKERVKYASVTYSIEVNAGCYSSGGGWDGFDDPEEDYKTMKVLTANCGECYSLLEEPPE